MSLHTHLLLTYSSSNSIIIKKLVQRFGDTITRHLITRQLITRHIITRQLNT